jgi:hypothetical protein
MKSPKEILVAARELISDPDHWAKGYFAFDKYNQRISPENKQAVKWCLVGAIRHSEPEGYANSIAAAQRIVSDLLADLPDASLPGYLGLFNDQHSHEEVLAVLDEAIEKAS